MSPVLYNQPISVGIHYNRHGFGLAVSMRRLEGRELPQFRRAVLLVFPKSQSGLGSGCETKSESSPGTCLQCSHRLQTSLLPLLRISVALIIAKGLPCSVEQLCGWEIMSVLLRATLHNLNPSVIASRLCYWNMPCVFCLMFLPELTTITTRPHFFH